MSLLLISSCVPRSDFPAAGIGSPPAPMLHLASCIPIFIRHSPFATLSSSNPSFFILVSAFCLFRPPRLTSFYHVSCVSWIPITIRHSALFLLLSAFCVLLSHFPTLRQLQKTAGMRYNTAINAVNTVTIHDQPVFTSAQPFGLIAGGGGLPVEFVRTARQLGIERIVAVGFRDYTPPDVAAAAEHYEEIGVGQLGRLIRIFKRHGVRDAVMLGSLSPRLTIANVRLDLRMLMLAARVRDRRADSVLGAIANELAKEGITLQPTTRCLPHLLATSGSMTKRTPTAKEWDDIRFGIALARAMGDLDVGQTVVVRKHAVVAVEAMEGTDACIKRAGTLISGGVVVKMAKPRQDLRFDVPCVGTTTIETMVEAECAVLAVEADKTFIVDRARTLALADAHKIALVGVRANEGAPLTPPASGGADLS